MRITSAGSVGIGTATPGASYKLDVAGSVNASGLCLGGDCKTAWSQVGGGSTSQWTTAGTSVYYSAGNVGVGTTSPSQALTVSGYSATSYGGAVQVIGTAPSGTAQNQLNITPTANSWGLIIGANNAGVTPSAYHCASCAHVVNYNNAPLIFGTNNAEKVRIDASGNVGIGTATPHSLLEVVGGTSFGTADGGNMTATDSSAMAQNVGGAISFAGKYDTAGDYAGFGRILGIKENATSGNYGGALVFQARANGGNQTEYMRITSTGNVGIGTAAPTTAKLVVSGSAGATGLDLSSTDQYAEMRIIRNSLGAADKDMYLQFQAGAGSKTHFYSNNSETMTLAGGSVGIGSTNPTHTLEVVGTINASQGITGATINATYQDVAEWVPSSQKLTSGTVVVLDTDHSNQVLASSKSYDTKVAGVVSARPGISLGEGGDGKLLVATTGRVKVKVDATRAPIKVGDLLVTSDEEGVAMKSVPVDLGGIQIHRPGTIIGKALEPLASGTGEILVLLSLQ